MVGISMNNCLTWRASLKTTSLIAAIFFSTLSFAGEWQYFTDIDFGIRVDSYGRGDFAAPRGGFKRKHTGVDYLLDYETTLYSPCDGDAKWSDAGAFGISVDIVCASPFEARDLKDYYFSFRFAHVDKSSAFVTEHEANKRIVVKKGENVALVGDSGNAKGTKPHVHLEVSVHNSQKEAEEAAHELKDGKSNQTLTRFLKSLNDECRFANENSGEGKRVMSLDHRFDPHVLFSCLDLVPEQLSSHEQQQDAQYPNFFRWDKHYQ